MTSDELSNTTFDAIKIMRKLNDAVLEKKVDLNGDAATIESQLTNIMASLKKSAGS